MCNIITVSRYRNNNLFPNEWPDEDVLYVFVIDFAYYYKRSYTQSQQSDLLKYYNNTYGGSIKPFKVNIALYASHLI